jgi:hypothetical protein
MPKIFENLWVKIAALLLAFLLWFHVATEKSYQYEIILPLAQVDLSEDLVLIEPPPDSIKVLVQAEGKALLRSDWKKSGLKLVVSGSRAAKFKTEISTGNLFLIKGEKVELLDVVSPREVVLQCEYKLTMDVPIHSQVIIVPDDGFAIDDIKTFQPDMVTLVGPRNDIRQIKFVNTEEKVIEGVRDDFESHIALQYPDIYGLRMIPDSVFMKVGVKPIKRRVFGEVPVKLINAPPGIKFKVDPARVEIRIGGKTGIVDSLTADHFSIIADYTMLDLAGYIPVQVATPPSVLILYKSADSVRLLEKK